MLLSGQRNLRHRNKEGITTEAPRHGGGEGRGGEEERERERERWQD